MTSTMTRDQVWNLMSKLGYAKVLVYFSGGNDSGGVDRILVEQVGDTEKELTGSGYYEGYTTDGKGGWVPIRPLTDEEELVEAFGAPVFAKYYTFAGEFYVDGIVTWDLAKREVKMAADEEVSSGEHFEEYI